MFYLNNEGRPATIYIDEKGHMATDGDIEFLHKFARIIGLMPGWFQPCNKKKTVPHPHYDLTTDRMRIRAARYGAVKITSKDMVLMFREKQERQARKDG